MKTTLNDSSSIKDLENQAKNTKHLMDRLSRAYIGLTVEEIIRLISQAKSDEGGKRDDDSND